MRNIWDCIEIAVFITYSDNYKQSDIIKISSETLEETRGKLKK